MLPLSAVSLVCAASSTRIFAASVPSEGDPIKRMPGPLSFINDFRIPSEPAATSIGRLLELLRRREMSGGKERAFGHSAGCRCSAASFREIAVKTREERESRSNFVDANEHCANKFFSSPPDLNSSCRRVHGTTVLL
ncbi:hypothetical protein V9T40_010579 [Parthenolecanium corni]|uniref:Secreted protein n=1 Tax=Parthenolecanium corni TaxID=536013 RepID=A0AAN9XYL1_9HEMI